MSKKFAPVILILIAMGCVLLYSKITSRSNNQISGASIQVSLDPVQAVGFEYGDLIKNVLAQEKPLANLPIAQIGITSHHLPTAAPLIAEFYDTLKRSQSPHQTFVVIGPDHYEHCLKSASTTRRSYNTPFGILNSNSQIIDDLEKNGGVAEIDGCFDNEHSVGVHSMFIKYLYPDSTIVPIIYSSAATDADVDRIAKVLAKYQDQITVIISVDFSHYQTTAVANQLDKDSGDMIASMDGSGLTLKHMDSPASIKTGIALAKIWQYQPLMLKHINSYSYTGQTGNTTGYWDIFFAPSSPKP